MTELITLDQVKEHLKQPPDSDVYLQALATAATGAVKLETGRRFDGTDSVVIENATEVAAQAALMLVETWWSDRGGEGEIPPAVKWLLMPLKVWTV